LGYGYQEKRLNVVYINTIIIIIIIVVTKLINSKLTFYYFKIKCKQKSDGCNAACAFGILLAYYQIYFKLYCILNFPYLF